MSDLQHSTLGDYIARAGRLILTCEKKGKYPIEESTQNEDYEKLESWIEAFEEFV